MSTQLAVVLLSVAAAFVFALSSSLKHVSAGVPAGEERVASKTFGTFVLNTLAHPLWLGGIACDVVALALQVLALHLGALDLVQPLLISGMLFALLLRPRFGGAGISRIQLVWAGVLAASLAVFVLVAHPGVTGGVRDSVDRGPAVTAGAVAGAGALVCIELGRRLQGGGRRSAFLGVAVGIIYAATAALLKAVTDITASDPEHLVTAWQTYALIPLGAGGLLLNQLAFRAGPLSASLPAIATVDPLLSIVVGVTVYDEHINGGPAAGTALLLLLLVMGTAVIQLARTTTRDPESQPSRPAR